MSNTGNLLSNTWLQQLRDMASQLSAREGEVIRLLMAGFSQKEIASLLGISPKTVNRHVSRANEKLDCSTVIQTCVKYSHQQGMFL